MRKMNKKAFTIVELVIVIAVIAVLAAVLIPTFTRLIRKSKINNDTQLIRTLNESLTADKVENKHVTMGDALKAANAYGYDIAKINAKASGNEIIWDSVNDAFVYVNDGSVEYLPDSVEDKDKLSANDYRLWKIYSEAVPADNAYSIYVGSQTAANSLENNPVAVGVDCGEYLINDLKYTNAGEKRVNNIYTNGGTLTINAPKDTVSHYGAGTVLNIESIDNASFHEFGSFTKANIAEGRVVVEESGRLPSIEITKEPTAEKPVKIETNADVVVSVASNVSVATLSNVTIKVTKEDAAVVVDEKISAESVEAKGKTAEDLVKITKIASVSEFVEAQDAGKTYLMLTDDIAVSSQFNITKSLTLDGNGHTITGYWRRGSTSNYPTIAINFNQTANMTDVVLKNVSVINTATTGSGRGIETRGCLNSLTLTNVNVEVQKSTGYRQPITIGGNQASVATIKIDNSTITCEAGKGYGIITFNPVDMTINDTTITSWAAIYMKGIDGSAGSRGSKVVATNCAFNCENINSGTSNEFGAIVFEDGAIDFTAKGCTFDVTQHGDQAQSAILFNSYWAEGSLDDVKVSLYDVEINGDIDGQSVAYNASNVLRIYSGTTVKDPSNYVAEGSQTIKQGTLYVIKAVNQD